MFNKVLVANRGEVACRIFRTCRALGIKTVAVYSRAEGTPMHVRLADESFRLPEHDTPANAYLDAEAIVALCVESGSDAIHPGYGFLSESPVLAEQCDRRGVTFVGPRPDIARLFADKWAARERMSSISVPVLPGARVVDDDISGLESAASSLGFPLIVKATEGGGGIGMQTVDKPERLRRAVKRAGSSAYRAFGSREVYLEKFLQDARHVEVQIIADAQGNVSHLWERECSAQRRHQKVIEEAPSPSLSPSARRSLVSLALEAARSIAYVGAGTFEFVMNEGQGPYFLEANARLQVEHGVTEMTTGVDIVEQQLRVAAGLGLTIGCDGEVRARGHAIQCRIYAEDPATFLPSPGVLQAFVLPDITNVRVDTGYASGDAVTPHFDPLLAKVIAWGENRAEALQLMKEALDATEVAGVKTNIPVLQQALRHPDFVGGLYTTGFFENLV
ncbi:MAG: ATP-grasp domain-containing protein [Chloroflexi bacterium]|nr:ATP-grasp domain-containing protein [Chloroflexota bacterium]